MNIFRGEYFPGVNIFQGWIFFRKFFSEYGVIYYDSVSDTDEFLIRSHQTAQSAHCALLQNDLTCNCLEGRRDMVILEMLVNKEADREVHKVEIEVTEADGLEETWNL